MQRDRSQNRPIRSRIVKQLGFTRRPFDEPLTPGLRRQAPTNAIGFTHDWRDDMQLPSDLTLHTVHLKAGKVISVDMDD